MNLKLQFQGTLIVSHEIERDAKDTVKRSLRESSPLSLKDLVTHADIIQEIKNLQNKKAPGVRDITDKVLKNLSISYIPQLTHSLITCLNLIVSLSPGNRYLCFHSQIVPNSPTRLLATGKSPF